MTFGLALLIGAVVWFQILLLWLQEFFGYNPQWGILHHILGKPTPFDKLVFHGLFFLTVYGGLKALWFLLEQFVYEIKWSRKVNIKVHKQYTQKMNQKFENIGFRIIVIEEESFVAMTCGFMIPRIILSTKVIRQFSDRELDTVIWHEYSHCRNRDPLRSLILRTLEMSLPYFPILRRFSHYIMVWMELLADQNSIRKMRTSRDLAGILLQSSQLAKKQSVGIGFADVAINYRIQQVVVPDQEIKVPLFEYHSIIFSISSIVLLTAAVFSSCS
ncbi:M56 family metallopeptidase [Paenibacillus montanisoli]|uniref:M56 family metallopeptidase n=1 Tax=Paenibacillus montanisoli TaxID=2081970 RepID=UPI0014039305|nr:M56 family metallopeptidase [Paenibacillus montanisoli]